MSFRINDYNAFLTSLFDKNNANQASDLIIDNQHPHQQSQHSNQQPPTIKQEPIPSGFPVDFDFGLIAPGSNLHNRNNQPEVPTLFGDIIPPTNKDTTPNNNNDNNNDDYDLNNDDKMETDLFENNITLRTNDNDNNKNSNNNSSINSYSNTDSPIILEPSLTLPDQQFDLYNINFNNQINNEPQNQIDEFENSKIKPEPDRFSMTISPQHQQQQIEEFSNPASPMSSSAPRNSLSTTNTTNTITNDQNDKHDSTAAASAAASAAAAAMGSNIPHRPRVKSAHNVIEQRYRNKINDKFTALQNSVPTLRVVARRKTKPAYKHPGHRPSTTGEDEDEEFDTVASPIDEHEDDDITDGHLVSNTDDLEGLEPARKLNKGTILAKSIEYIKFLELKNERMKQEHQELLQRARMLGLSIDDDLASTQ